MSSRYQSPLRYPGGKAGIASLLEEVLHSNKLDACSYYEPFAGGAGAALRLLVRDKVSEVHLNDADPRVFAFWKAATEETERFADAIRSAILSIDEWRKQHAICASPRGWSQFDIGFATFYMNRCNRSGVLLRAGPIGGYEQDGGWTLDARFNRDALAERIVGLGRCRKRIHIYKMDGLAFLATKLPRGRQREAVFVFLDPPYHGNGRRLYLNHFDDRKHRELARYMSRQKTLRWLMCYDNVDFIRRLYAGCTRSSIRVHYSLHRRYIGRELVVLPACLNVPARLRRTRETPDLGVIREGLLACG